MHGINNNLFDLRSESRGVPVRLHGAVDFVAAFDDDASRGDVAGDVVGVGRDPERSAGKLSVETEGVVGNDFAR